MKHKNEGKSWKAIFVDGDGALRSVWELIFVFIGICVGLAIVFWAVGLFIVYSAPSITHTPMENYTEQYEACMATERFTQYQCHEIGIEVMGL